MTTLEQEITRRFRPALDLVDRLAARWADEREYEDFADYAEAMKKATPEGLTFVRATKRPFGFIIRTGSGDFHLFATGSKVGWKAI